MKNILWMFLTPLILSHTYAQVDSLKRVSLKEVVINKAKPSTIKSVQPIRASVLDMNSFRDVSTSVVELMNRTAGVRIQQSGGLGNKSNLILNGFEGKAIKYFRDGIPMDYLGNAFSFAIVPANGIDRVEIYRGVIPVELGADALGGAVNIVTRTSSKPHSVDLSYQVGSFNTHRVTANIYRRNDRSGWFSGINMFYNYSDNNYKVDVPINDRETAVSHIESHRLFHNKFNNGFTEVYTGLSNQAWADDIRLTLTGFYLNKDRNYGLTMNYPFGAVESKMHSIVPTLRYRKELLDYGLKIDQFLAYNTLHTEFSDTTRGYYDWRGDFHSVPSRIGESTMDGSLQKLNFRNFISRTNLQKRLSGSILELNIISSQIQRTGTDPYGETFAVSGKDLLAAKNKYGKWIIGGGIRNCFFEDRLINDLSAKLYILNTEGYENARATESESFRSKSAKKWGFSEAAKYQFSSDLFVRMSGEIAYRLPEQEEFFGDGNFISSSFTLNPEKSYNINLGVSYKKENRFSYDANVFYRKTHDLILLISTGIYGNYVNVNKVKGIGVEMDASYKPLGWLELRGNYTYQDFRLFGQKDPTFEGSRLRNTPYFFSNLGAYTRFENVVRPKDTFTFYWNYSFVREFYLDYIPKAYEPDGFLGLWGKPGINIDAHTIPSQHLHTAGVSWKPLGAWGVGLEARNVFNSKVFDNYRIQNEGLCINFKINMSL